MRVAIAGAGNVGRSIAQELIENGHQVMLIERAPERLRPERVPQAEWILADACEVASLQEAGLATCDVMIAATGDDKVNIVVSLLAKTEFAVNRVVARVNDPRNEWLFTDSWGVDVAVSTPRIMSALVEEAVSIGGLVQLLTLRQGQANLVEVTLPEDTSLSGKRARSLALPHDTALVAILRGGRVIVPTEDDTVEAGDELLFVAAPEVEPAIREAVGL